MSRMMMHSSILLLAWLASLQCYPLHAFLPFPGEASSRSPERYYDVLQAPFQANGPSALNALANYLLRINPSVALGLRRSSRTGVPLRKVPRLSFDRTNLLVQMAGAEEERKERLQQLFGQDAGEKIADRTMPKKAPVEPIEIESLQDGMLALEWGNVQLVNVESASRPLEGSFEPLLPESKLLCIRLDMPLGAIIEVVEEGVAAGSPVIAGFVEDSRAEKAGVQVGDILRATTAMSYQMDYPAWQVMLGGVGRPKIMKILASTSALQFEALMQAIASNSQEMQGNGQVIFLLERATGKCGTSIE